MLNDNHLEVYTTSHFKRFLEKMNSRSSTHSQILRLMQRIFKRPPTFLEELLDHFISTQTLELKNGESTDESFYVLGHQGQMLINKILFEKYKISNALQILLYLKMQKNMKGVTYEELKNMVWGENNFTDDEVKKASLSRTITNLRDQGLIFKIKAQQTVDSGTRKLIMLTESGQHVAQLLENLLQRVVSWKKAKKKILLE